MSKKINRIEIIVFFLLTFGMSMFCGTLIYFGIYENSEKISTFMMLTPATGVVLAKMCSRSEKKEISRLHKMIITVFGITLFGLVLRATGVINEQLFNTFLYIPVFVISTIAFIYSWVFCPELSPFKNIKGGVKYLLIYAAINIAVVLIMNLKGVDYRLFMGLCLSFAYFPTQCLLTFGEEYGWRGYLQPLLQEKFGKRWGVIFVGILWQIWHVPFYFPDKFWDGRILFARFIYLPALSVVLGYVYMKTENVWLIAYMHFINNLILGSFLPVYTDIRYLAAVLLISGIWFLLLFTKEYKKTKQ